MCEPTTIALAALAISSVGVVAQQDAQRKQVNSQQDALHAQAVDDANTRSTQMDQVSEQAAQAANERNQRAREEAATFDVVTGEYGGGVSAGRSASAIQSARMGDLATIGANKGNQLVQLGHEGQSSALRYQSSLASLNRPSTLGTSLKIAGNAASAYSAYNGSTGNTSSKTPNWDLSKTNRGSGD